MTGLLTRSTIVVVTWRGKGHVSACLDAVAAQTRPHRLLVIDNASDDGTTEVLARHPSSPDVVRLPVNVGYAGALAAVDVETEFTAWLNDDAEPEPNWLAQLEDALDEDREAAAAASRMVGVDGEVISLGVGLTPDGHGVDLVSGPPFGFCGGAVLLRTAVLRQVGGVPARFFCYYEDTDTAWRLRLAGHTIVSVPDAVVTHRHGASTKPGSWQFHLWNERNRLAMLIRCAPAGVAAREVARFAAITALLPLRRAAGRFRPASLKAGQPPANQPPGGEPPANQPPGGEPLANQPSGGEPLANQPSASQPPDGQPPDNRPLASQPSPSQPPRSQPPANQSLAGRDCRWSPVTWKPGDPQAHESPTRSGSAGEPVPSSHSTPRKRRSLLVAWKSGDPRAHESPIRSGWVGEPSVPWNFRVGLRLQVLREIATTLCLLLQERRTISRVANVPRSVVWRRSRSMNSPS